MNNKEFMEKLTKKEEKVMEVLWKKKKVFVKDVMKDLEGQRLHYNTVSTIIRNLEEKNFLSHRAFGRTHQYYPLVTKEDYGKALMKGAMAKFFNNSYQQMLVSFAKEEELTPEELKEIIAIIENKK